MPPSPFFAKLKSFFLFIWNWLKKWIKGQPNINVERARDVLIVAPNLTAGHDIKEVTITVSSSRWPEKAKAAQSVVPTVITLPSTSSPDQRAILVYKGIMRGLRKASKVLDPVVAQALYLCSTYKAAILANDGELAKTVEEKLERLSAFRAEGGYIPPDIKMWYQRFVAIDKKGNLSGVVIPVLEFASEKLTADSGRRREMRQECAHFIRWLHSSMTKLEAREFVFKGKYLNVGLVFVADMNMAEYFGIAASLLKDQECEMIIMMAYGHEYTIKSMNTTCMLNALHTMEACLSRVILAPKLEGEPFLASYFIFHSHIPERKSALIDEWKDWEQKVTSRNNFPIFDRESGLANISRLVSYGKTMIVTHAWNTKPQFWEVCFEAVTHNKAKIVCHRTEIRKDGGPERDQPTSYISLVLAPSEA